MQRIKISVIIPTFNEESNIGELLGFLTSVQDVEVIVADGGSTDKTYEVCRDFPIKFVNAPLGRGQQLNAGSAESVGEILFFVHADSKLENGVFQELSKVIDHGCLWGCCKIAFDDTRLFFRALAIASELRARVFSSCYGDQGIFCERNLFYSVGGFPNHPLLEDIGISRLLRRKSKACFLQSKIITSSRRFTKSGPWRVLVRMQLIKLLFALGVNPEKLAKLYKWSPRRNYETSNSDYEQGTSAGKDKNSSND